MLDELTKGSLADLKPNSTTGTQHEHPIGSKVE